ncbi:hypothetical protein P692DRAFT_20822164 [Suillus brevipes Sb2]|nr:hypothetical protein P692DRAFT_20822164 [Suillus brevipes Sb2]
MSLKSQTSDSDGRSTRGWSCDDGEVETHVGVQKMLVTLSEVHQDKLVIKDNVEAWSQGVASFACADLLVSSWVPHDHLASHQHHWHEELSAQLFYEYFPLMCIVWLRQPRSSSSLRSVPTQNMMPESCLNNSLGRRHRHHIFLGKKVDGLAIILARGDFDADLDFIFNGVCQGFVGQRELS